MHFHWNNQIVTDDLLHIQSVFKEAKRNPFAYIIFCITVITLHYNHHIRLHSWLESPQKYGSKSKGSFG